jgi:hypothetical protein
MMAGFLLDISGKSESTVFARRLKNDSFENGAISGNPDFDFNLMHELGIDPYRDYSWSGVKLEKLETTALARYEKCKKHIEKSVLDKTHQQKVEAWMAPMITEQIKMSPEYGTLEKLINMIETAKRKNGTIVFIGD